MAVALLVILLVIVVLAAAAAAIVGAGGVAFGQAQWPHVHFDSVDDTAWSWLAVIEKGRAAASDFCVCLILPWPPTNKPSTTKNDFGRK